MPRNPFEAEDHSYEDNDRLIIDLHEEITHLLALNAELLDVLTLALPYVEMTDPEPYKAGAVEAIVSKMRSVIDKADQGAS